MKILWRLGKFQFFVVSSVSCVATKNSPETENFAVLRITTKISGEVPIPKFFLFFCFLLHLLIFFVLSVSILVPNVRSKWKCCVTFYDNYARCNQQSDTKVFRNVRQK